MSSNKPTMSIRQHFSWPDYTVFGLMLLSCILIGIYFGWKDHRKKQSRLKSRRGSEALDYLVGGRRMKVFPVAMSLVASFISGISLLGTSTEMYIYGTQYCYIFLSILVMGAVMNYFYFPVYHDLQLTSIYEYLERRFDRKMRLFGSILFLVHLIFYMPIVIYVPALALNQVSGLSIQMVSTAVSLVCIFYTSVGGLKAVVYTDVLQIFVMLGSILLVVFKGTIDVGGPAVVFQRNLESARFDSPNLSLDPTIRLTLGSVFIGGLFSWMSFIATDQALIQRILSLPTLTAAKRSFSISVVGLVFLLCLCAYNGLLAFATFHDCDPLTTGLAEAEDQIIPLLVMKVLGEYPGLSGFFVVGVFCAALSTLSTGLNAVAAVVLEDFWSMFASPSEKSVGRILRLSTIIFGLIALGMVFVVERIGTTVLQLSFSLESVSYGPLFGIFTLGVLFPSVNAKCALTGGITALLSMAWIVLRAQFGISTGEVNFDRKPMSVEGCLYEFDNSTLNLAPTEPMEEADRTFYHLSYLYYAFLGCAITCTVAYASRIVFGTQNPKEIDEMLLAPPIRRWWGKKVEQKEMDGIQCQKYTFEAE